MLKEEIEKGDEDERWLATVFDDPVVSTADRNILAIALLSQAHEHCVAVRHLCQNDTGSTMFGSACALLRPIFECLIRGTWVFVCATDEQIAVRMDPDNDDEAWRPGIHGMVAAVERVQGGRFYSDLLTNVWDAFCSYNHGGLRAASNQVIEGAVQPRVDEAMMCEVVRFSRIMQLLTANACAMVCDREEDARACSARLQQLQAEVPRGAAN